MTGNGQAPAREKPWQELEEDARKAEAVGPGVKVTVAGKVYQLHFGEMSGLDVRALRQEIGLSGLQLLQSLLASPDIDLVAAVVWMACRLAGEQSLSYDDVAGAMRWGAGTTLEWVDATPEAPPEVRDEATGEAEHPQA